MTLDVTMTVPVFPKGKSVDFFNRFIPPAIVAASNELKAAFFNTTPLATGLTRIGWRTVAPRRGAGGFVGGVVNSGSSGMSALVLEEGAKPHFPPIPKQKKGEPALGTWIRRKLGAEFKITEKISGKQTSRPLDTGNIADVRKAAFLIGRKFKKSGIRARRIYSLALTAVKPSLDAILQRGGQQWADAVKKDNPDVV